MKYNCVPSEDLGQSTEQEDLGQSTEQEDLGQSTEQEDLRPSTEQEDLRPSTEQRFVHLHPVGVLSKQQVHHFSLLLSAILFGH